MIAFKAAIAALFIAAPALAGFTVVSLTRQPDQRSKCSRCQTLNVTPVHASNWPPTSNMNSSAEGGPVSRAGNRYNCSFLIAENGADVSFFRVALIPCGAGSIPRTAKFMFGNTVSQHGNLTQVQGYAVDGSCRSADKANGPTLHHLLWRCIALLQCAFFLLCWVGSKQYLLRAGSSRRSRANWQPAAVGMFPVLTLAGARVLLRIRIRSAEQVDPQRRLVLPCRRCLRIESTSVPTVAASKPSRGCFRMSQICRTRLPKIRKLLRTGG